MNKFGYIFLPQTSEDSIALRLQNSYKFYKMMVEAEVTVFIG